MPYYVILGAAAGLVSVFVIKMYTRISKQYGHVRNPWVKGLIGSAILYLAILMFPALRGDGYHFIRHLLTEPEVLCSGSPLAAVFSNPWVFLLLTFLLVFLKAMTSISSLESGADGGIFAPSMFIGAFLPNRSSHCSN